MDSPNKDENCAIRSETENDNPRWMPSISDLRLGAELERLLKDRVTEVAFTV